MSAPLDEYQHRLLARRASFDLERARDEAISRWRLVTFGVGIVLAFLAWRGVIAVWALALPIAAFVWLMRRHETVIRARDAAARAVVFYERGLARLEDRWPGTGEPGERFKDDHHVYANDLDLFGTGSLFELLSIARTRAGEETLADWLLEPAEPAEVAERRGAVVELTPGLDIRERLALAGSEVRAGVDTEALRSWVARPPILTAGWQRTAAVALTALAVATLAYWLIADREGPFLVVLALEVLYSLPLRRRVDQALHAAASPARDLDLLAHVLTELEGHRFECPRLRELSDALRTTGIPASAAIRRLHTLVERHDWQHNAIFAAVSPIVLWGTHLAFAVERRRAAHGVDVTRWLATVGNFEALSSLAAYRYEHPDDPFPVLVDGAATFDGVALGHPLIPGARMVRNDVRLDADTPLLIVSGSNMSGKSTLLRTTGINAVLALAGAPVRAASLRMTPLRVGATLRIQDSLQEGRSRFYAEISRIKTLADLARSGAPLLFLLDELLHGTNSHDRRVGAAGILTSLVGRGAIGLFTTHDLALTHVADDLGGRARNIHFEDRLVEGEIQFDYAAKPGPVTRSNAIALMRAVGLDVAADAERS